MNSWAAYVREQTKGESQTDASDRTGISQTTIGRWLRGAQPRWAEAAKFAQAGDGDVLAAFVAAGFLTAAEAGATVVVETDLESVDNHELAAEVTRRLTAADESDYMAVAHAADSPEPTSKRRPKRGPAPAAADPKR